MNKPVGRFDSILSSFTDGVLILNSDYQVEWVNSAGEQLIGASLAILMGASAEEIFGKKSVVITALRESRDSGSPRTDHDTSITNRNSESVSVGVTVHPIVEENEGGAVVILRDLTSLKTLERFMGMNEKMENLSILAAGMAHEIKNPLGGIRGAAQLIKREKGSEPLKEYLDLIISEVDRINRLVVDLIDLNQPDALKKEECNIYPVLDDVMSLLRGELTGKLISVKRDYDPSLPPVFGDPDRLRQIFLNIIKNGVEACDRGGEITLKTSLAWKVPRSLASRDNKKFLLVEVVDSGHGIKEEERASIFTPFSSRKKGGAGLGLSITMGLVQAHEGILSLDNRKDEKGAKASIYLPYIK